MSETPDAVKVKVVTSFIVDNDEIRRFLMGMQLDMNDNTDGLYIGYQVIPITDGEIDREKGHVLENDLSETDESPYCPKCGSCGEHDCCGERCTGGENCLYGNYMISDVKAELSDVKIQNQIQVDGILLNWDEERARYAEELARLCNELDEKDSELKSRKMINSDLEASNKMYRREFSSAAKEINCAGSITHRIRVLKKEHQETLEEYKEGIEIERTWKQEAYDRNRMLREDQEKKISEVGDGLKEAEFYIRALESTLVLRQQELSKVAFRLWLREKTDKEDQVEE